MSREEWLEGAHGYPVSTKNPIPAQEEEQGNPVSNQIVAVLAPECHHERRRMIILRLQWSSFKLSLFQLPLMICVDVRLGVRSSPDRLRGTIN